MNATVTTTDAARAREIVDDARWLGTAARGRVVVPIRADLPGFAGRVVDWRWVGLIPTVSPGDRFTYSAVTYAVALVVALDAASRDAAQAHLDSLAWFVPQQGLAYVSHSAPEEAGRFDDKLPA